MRKITRYAAIAFRGGDNWSLGNTTVCDGAMYLHGNKIAERREDGVYCTLAGWNTPTTRERLNGLLEILGIPTGFYQHRWEAFYHGRQIDPSEWIKVK